MGKQANIWVYALVSMFITVCISGFGRMSYGILMPFMRESLSLTYQQAGVLATATAIGYLALVLWVGLMATLWGSKRLVAIGLIVLTVSLIALFFVHSYVAVIICMVLLGLGTAFSYTPLVNIVSGWFPERRGLMIGFLLSGMGVGTLTASLLIPVYNHLFGEMGWRYLWLTFGIITIFALVVCLLFLQDPPTQMTKAGRQGAEQKPSLLKEVYLHPGVLLISIIYGFIGFAYLIPSSFLFSFYLQQDISEYEAGLINGFGGFVSVFSGPFWGAISDRIGRKYALQMVLALSSLSVFVTIMYPSLVGFTIGQICWGLALMGMLSLSQALAIEQTDIQYAPAALGYATVFFATGQILGPSLGGWIIEVFHHISAALWLCLGLLLLSTALTTFIKKKEIDEL